MKWIDYFVRIMINYTLTLIFLKKKRYSYLSLLSVGSLFSFLNLYVSLLNYKVFSS